MFNTKDLLRQADLMISAHGGCLIEEFVEGREFTVLVAENPDDPRTPVAYQAHFSNVLVLLHIVTVCSQNVLGH